MSKNFLNELIAIMREDQTHISLARVKKLFVAEDRSSLKVQLELMPEGREVIGRVTWDKVGDNSGDFKFPVAEDICLVAFAHGDENQCYVLKWLTNDEDTIPEQVMTGDSASISMPTKKNWFCSDTRINLARSKDEPVENMVLGQVFKTFMTDLLTKIEALEDLIKIHTHVGNMGAETSPPSNAADITANKEEITALKESPIGDDLILSDLIFGVK